MSGVSYYPEPDRRTGAQLSAGPGGLEVQAAPASAAGTSAQIWPWAELQLSWGGSETRLLRVDYSGQSLYIPGPLALELFAQHLRRPQQLQVLDQARRQLRKGRNARIWLLAGVGSLTLSVLLVWGSWRGLLWSRDYALRQIPPAWEAELGAQAFAEMRKESPLCASDALQQAVQQLGQRLQTPGSPYNLSYSVLRNESINAFALPGGQIGIHAALIAKAPGPEALAGVMAHEAAHVYAQHGLKSLLGKMGLGLLTLVIFGDMGSVMLALGGMGVGLIGLSFSRAQEAEADARGLALLQQAGLDPRGMPAFFDWLQAEEKQAGPAFLSTHPLSAERLQTLEQTLQDLPARAVQLQPLSLDWPALQAAARDCLKAAQ